MFTLRFNPMKTAVIAALMGAAGPALAQDLRPAQTLPEVPPAPVANGAVEAAPPSGVPMEATIAPAVSGCDACGSGTGTGFDWKVVPRTRPLARTGIFLVPSRTPGYYSVLDQIRGEWREAPPKYPYPRVSPLIGSFFDFDNFSYLEDPNNTEHDFFDPLKRIHIGDNWLFTTGGELRTRYMNEYNSRLTQTNNVYNLDRVRIYGDLWYRDDFRVFVEGIGAWTQFGDLKPLPVDQNMADLLNAFVDVKLADLGGKPAYIRVGRQEMGFGSQRLISPLDWPNTRRTFQGVRAFRQTEKFDFDVFWVQPIIPNAYRFDSVDNNQNFAGAWATYRPVKGQSIDAYYLMLDNTNSITQQGIKRGNFTRHTIGGRYAGNIDSFLFDSETAFQFGSQNGRDVFAAMTTQGVGYNFKDATWNPTVWLYYDYASGGGATSGTAHTFNQLFPFAHPYFGWVDQVGRQNIHDLNCHLFLYPTKWLTSSAQFHSFWLANKTDALYNAGGNAIRRSASGVAGAHVGEELDLIFNFHLSKHADILTGYSYLWGGEFLRNTASRTAGKDTSLTYLQFSYRW